MYLACLRRRLRSFLVRKVGILISSSRLSMGPRTGTGCWMYVYVLELRMDRWACALGS